MAIELKVTGNGYFAGSATALESYSTTEESTPIDPSDSSGGTGQVNFSVVDDPEGTIFLLNDTVELTDGSNGRTQGVVNGVSGANGLASISADSRLSLLVADRTAEPFVGTLEAAFRYYLSIADITNRIVVDEAIANRPVVFPGWTGNIWDAMKQMATAQQVEISLVSSNIVLRPIRGRTVRNDTDASISWSANNTDLAQSIEIYYYNNTYNFNKLVYPAGGWNEDVQIYQVDAGERLEVEIEVPVSMESVVQPTMYSYVGPNHIGPESAYAVIGNDDKRILPAQWRAAGGDLRVSIGEDTKTLKLTLVGANIPEYAPFRFALSDGENTYSTLRIQGAGVFTDKQILTIPTGAPASKTAQVVGVTIDNPFINTITDAYTAGMVAAGKWASAATTINVDATTINRQGENGSTRYPTFGEFDQDWAGKTFGAFDAAWAGKTHADLTAYYFERVADNFENQAFGNVAGARAKFRYAWYRVRSASLTPSGISYQAEGDTTFGDFDKNWAGRNFADFDLSNAGATFADFSLTPLRAPEIAPLPPVSELPWPYLFYPGQLYPGAPAVTIYPSPVTFPGNDTFPNA